MAKLILGQVLKRKGVTKYEFAKRLGRPYQSVFRYFRAGYDPKLSSLARWAKALKVRVRDLIQE